jgi:hypothetical protein
VPEERIALASSNAVIGSFTTQPYTRQMPSPRSARVMTLSTLTDSEGFGKNNTEAPIEKYLNYF